MNNWDVASIILMTVIFWLNATIVATPYVNHLSGMRPLTGQGFLVSIGLLVSGVLLLLVQTGSFAMSGLLGMFDPLFLELIWTGPVGSFFQLQVLVALFWFVYCWLQNNHLKTGAWILAIAFMMWSFLSFGHSGNVDWWHKVALSVHILGALLWFGSLNSLRRACSLSDVNRIKALMIAFGQHMLWLVPILLVAGIVVFWGITGRWIPSMPLSAYEIVLLIKLALVVMVLAIAASHKIWLVPKLNTQAAVTALKRSITLEMIAALAVITVATALSTSFSP